MENEIRSHHDAFELINQRIADFALQKKKAEIDLSSVNSAIDQARSRAYLNSRFINSQKWSDLHKNRSDLLSKVRLLEEAIGEAKAERRRLTEIYRATFDSVFREVAKAVLTPDQFAEIVAGTKKRAALAKATTP